MIVIDDVVHHTGDNTEEKRELPLSRFAVSVRTKNNEPFTEPAEVEAVDEGAAIAQYIQENSIPNKKTSVLKFKAKVVKENRSDALSPPEPRAKTLASPKKAPAEETKTTAKKGSSKGEK